MFQTMPIFTKSKHNASRVKKNKDAEKTSKEPQRPDRDRERELDHPRKLQTICLDW